MNVGSADQDDPGKPKLSVVMPVFNALPHLDQAIESILSQSFSDFEFVILDDASTDGSAERLEHWAAKDSRIRLLHSAGNLGPVGSSNMVARAARAPIVARMDADDISYPERLQRQFEVFQMHPQAGVVGSLCDMIDARGVILRPSEAWRISRRSPFVPFAHGAMTYRREVFDRVGGYRDECAYWEDQDLVVRMAEVAHVLVIPDALYRVRVWTSSTRLSSNPVQLEDSLHRAYETIDQLQANGRYPKVDDSDAPERVSPRVFIALGSVQLWAGAKPRLFRRLMRRGQLALSPQTLAALVWTGWASVSPGSLRVFLRLLLNMRNLAARRGRGRSDPIRWNPFALEGNHSAAGKRSAGNRKPSRASVPEVSPQKAREANR